LIRAPLSITSVLDEATEAVRATATPWGALLIATVLPFRFLQAVFIDRLYEVGSKATEYGDLLASMANVTAVAFLVALWGRAVFARACRLAESRDAAVGREALRVPLAGYCALVLVSGLAQMISYALVMTGIGILGGILLSGLAVGTMELNDAPGVRGPFRHVGKYARQTKILGAMLLIFVCAFVVAMINIAAAFHAIWWLASSIGGWDAPRWNVLLGISNRRFNLMVVTGALVALEPFWVAANVTLVRKAGAAETGDDLRVWFEELQTS
jgi:hypothetical protein